MRLKGKLQNFVIGALALSIGVTTYLYMASLDTRSASSSEDSTVYVAVKDIAAGESFELMLREGKIALKRFPASSISVDAINDKGSLSPNLISSQAINNGQLILRTMFAPARNFASGLKIPKGELAISISVDDVSRVANFVVPGSRVIIYSTGTDPNRGEILTKILVSNALVLAVGAEVTTPYLGTQVSPSPLVTLAVDPSNAARIVNANQTSKLSLALAHANEPKALSLSASSISSSTPLGRG
jgi:Flp pilus assembly protein CpaB